jgi:hypothetical protein
MGVSVQTINAEGNARIQVGPTIITRGSTGFDFKNRQKILNWLSPLSFHEAHERISNQALLKDQSTPPGEEQYHAGKWLLDSNTFDDWQSRKPGRLKLWYYGMRKDSKSAE